MRRPLLSVATAALLAATAGCGDDDGGATRTLPAVAPQPPASSAPAPPQPQPAAVPDRPTGPADPAAAAVVRRWSAALRAGRVARAAGYFALPSHVQNGTPVVTLQTPEERTVFNATLPCGAVPVRFGGARGYTIVTFRLTERVGGDCGGAAGNRARCAIRVRGGRITDWYRLRDTPPTGPAPVTGRSGQLV